MDTREHIIEKSMTMFLNQGLKSIRMDDIAAQLGISKRTIYEIFDSKEALIIECISYYFDIQQKADCKKIVGASNVIEEFLIILEGNREAEFQVNIRFMNDLNKFYPSIYAKVIEDKKMQGVALLKERLKKGVEEGIFVSWINRDFAALTLSSSLNNIFLNPSSYEQSNMSISLAFKYTVVCFLRGISTSKGIEITDEMIRRFDCEME